jgi:hypothetical protein
MDGDRTHRALLRIDIALARLESAAQQPARSGDGDLAARHARLRGALTEVLGRLDNLISEQKQ